MISTSPLTLISRNHHACPRGTERESDPYLPVISVVGHREVSEMNDPHLPVVAVVDHREMNERIDSYLPVVALSIPVDGIMIVNIAHRCDTTNDIIERMSQIMRKPIQQCSW